MILSVFDQMCSKGKPFANNTQLT